MHAVRWQNDRTSKSGWSPAVVGGWANSKRPDREYEPLTDSVIEQHLAGELTAGLYPLLRNDRCRLLVCDFDGGSWALDALAYLDACRAAGLPAVLERSRSGDGGHVWVFFSGPVPAADARKVGAAMLRRAMASRVEIDLASYDRLFPSQDTMPKGSFGNLIALPLQGTCRKRGTTVFLDPTTLEPYEDQWAFLSTVPLASPAAVTAIAESVRPLTVGVEAADWEQQRDSHPAPPVIRASLGGDVVDRTDRATGMATRPVEASRMPAQSEVLRERTPAVLQPRDAEVDPLLRRGTRHSSPATRAARRCPQGDRNRREHARTRGPPQRSEPIDVTSAISLTSVQQTAVDAVVDHGHAVLVAPTGSGKTVMACALIAQHKVPTLILVDRTQLVDQWKSRLMEHLGLNRRQVGRLAATAKASGVVDIATYQAVARRPDASKLFDDYGLVIVDECHHLPARSFELAVREARSRRWLGLTATPYRRDGLEAIITMYCGPVRHEIQLADTPSAALTRRLHVHDTTSSAGTGEIGAIQDVFRALVDDTARTRQIVTDIAAAVSDGRNVLVLTQWTEHLDALAADLTARGLEPLVLKGGLGKKARTAVTDQLAADPAPTGQLLLATGSYLGEGFDAPSLDTLFLAFPLAFKGRVVQYIGRILRTTDTKTHIEVHDYLDPGPVFRKMHSKRLATYKTLGFDPPPRR